MAQSGNAAALSATEHFDMKTYFHHNVESFISGSTDPKWNEFLSLIDQLTVGGFTTLAGGASS
jgi:hypothetical protein